MVFLTMQEPFSGKTYTMALPTTKEKVIEWFSGTTNLPLIQNFFPELNTIQREFLLTGYTPESWNEIFTDEEKEN